MISTLNNDTISKLIENPHEIKAERCRRSFFYFMQEFWEEICGEDPVWNWHIEEVICKELERIAYRIIARKKKEYDLIFNVPPGSTKSITITQMFPAWVWIARLPLKGYRRKYRLEREKQNTRNPFITGGNTRFITGSYDAALSLEHADYTRDIVRSDKYQLYFPEVKIRKDKELKSNYKTNQGGSRFSCSTTSRVTGVHAHIIIVDDPLNPKKSISDQERVTANRWLDHTLSTRKVDKSLTVTILVMQRLHVEDCAGHLLNKKKKGLKIKYISLPGHTYKTGCPTFNVHPEELAKKYIGGLLDPVRLSHSALDELRIQLGNQYSGQIGQDPIDEGGLIFDSARLMSNMIKEVKPKRILSSVRYWDKAGTQDGGKRTAGVLIHKVKGFDFEWLIAHCVKGQWSYGKREKVIGSTAKLDGSMVRIWVEQEPGSGGKESAERTIKNLSGYIAKADKVTGDKFVRMEALASQIEIGNVGILEGPWTQDFLDEMRICGPSSTFVDQCDAASGAFNKSSEMKEGVLW